MLSPPGETGTPSSSRRDWTQRVTSVTAACALLFTGVSVQQTRSQLRIAAQGQVSERFGRSVEQLSSSTLGVRLGGIYALERLARDSPADQPTVVEVLSAFIREHARDQLTPVWIGMVQYLRPATDVRAALTVLSRRNTSRDNGATVDLLSANLAHLVLAHVRLPGAHLDRADLTGVNLSEANLAGATLIQARASGANLNGADLTRADLTEATLTEADLTGAALREADLTLTGRYGANLEGADLTGAVRRQPF